ncbi:interferon-stimulated 20 kDa exonuclease-like 2 [Scyliorhinus canicula]|uniref:interferon-stimulated 20 kDa exonuclease-like 2 n=1 Tax=Scyliorhinus canicula TaxID=7830 RepID=UPI0018F66C89|nr:interferon-stimulated 20 kDa exonuclease-like 2 [Scyliorhinus canicula]
MCHSMATLLRRLEVHVSKWLPLVADGRVSQKSGGVSLARRSLWCLSCLRDRPQVRGPLPAAARNMSDIMLNLDYSSAVPRQLTQPKLKHRRFLKRRPFLEKKGYLKKKQCKRAEEARPSGQPANQGGRACQPAQPPPLPASCTARLAGPGVANGAWAQLGRPRGNGAFQQRKPPPISTFPPPSGPALPAGGRPPALRPERGLLLSECQSALPPLPPSARAARPSAPAPRASFRPYKYVALDCEMVGTGPGGKRSELARCSITGYDGDLLYDKYILPQNPIVDYRTRWSGIRRQHMKNATPFQLAQKEVRSGVGEGRGGAGDESGA